VWKDVEGVLSSVRGAHGRQFLHNHDMCALSAVVWCVLLCAIAQVWKDVDGVLSSDPRIVSEAQPVNELTYEEATELAFFGAQVCVESDNAAEKCVAAERGVC
jgi:uridylate kinase